MRSSSSTFPAARQRWTKNQLNLLGRRPDVELAMVWKLSVRTIKLKRAELGIPAFRFPGGARQPAVTLLKVVHAEASTREGRSRVWTPEALALLGTMPDATLAHRLGISPMYVRKRRLHAGIPLFERRHRWTWSKSDLARLGKVPDRLLADRLGVTTYVVRMRRQALGIPESTMEWTPERVGMLGRKPDSRLAAEWGVPAGWVRSERIERAVPAFAMPARK